MAPFLDQSSLTPTLTDPIWVLHQSPKPPTSPCHSHHAHSFTYPPRLQSGDGKPRIDMERPFFRTFPRRDGELCLNTSPPMDSTGVEPGDANSEPANEAQTTNLTNSLPHATNSCLSAPFGAPLPSPGGAFTSPTSQVEKHSNEPIQCGLFGPTTHSHFSFPGSRWNKHNFVGRWAQPIHNHVLKPKPTICRVRHALG